MDSAFHKPIKVTISDPETGWVLEERTIVNDYVLITAGNRYLKSLQIWGKTHIASIAVEKPPKTETSGGG